MHKEGEEIHIDETDASGGTKTGHMRWVLGIGLFLAVVGAGASIEHRLGGVSQAGLFGHVDPQGVAKVVCHGRAGDGE